MKLRSLRMAGEKIAAHKVKFLLVFFIVFSLTYGLLYALDWVPEPKSETADEALETDQAAEMTAASAGDTIQYEDPLPTVIRFPKLDREVTVLNPNSRSIAALDEALLSGAVRHPDSADLLEEGNIFILGHSSYLPRVFNQNFQAFNGIQDLVWGDVIEIESEDGIYTYQIQKVYKAKVSSMTVPLVVEGHMLTLATCDSFGSTEDRFIVEAKRLEVTPKTGEAPEA